MVGMKTRPVCALLALAMLPLPAMGQLPGDSAKKIAHFHLSGALTETPQEDPFGLMAGKATSLESLLRRLAKARKDDSVKAVVLTTSGMSMGAAQIEELRDELNKFRAMDKRVFVHVDSLNTWQYALLSAASDLSIVPTADVWLTGMYGEGLYAKDLLTKIGCAADIIHIGDFKSAGEIFTRTEPSGPARENLNWLLDGLYEGLVDMIAQSRDITPKQARKMIDGGPYTAERALAAGLVDSVKYRDEFIEEVKSIYGKGIEIDNRYDDDSGVKFDFSNPFAFFSVLGEMFGGGGSKDRAPSIGIVYVEGAIVPGYGQPSPFGGSSGAFSGDIRKALREAADDDSVKAVVLRVDSPGGSALASEIILRATEEVREQKPLIVSMGNVAGSGGYYVACGSDAIFADATTITGSIGVVGGKIVTTDMWNKIGINWVPFKRGENADLLNSRERFTDGQRQKITDWMNEIYDVFKGHVTKCRGDKLTKPLDSLAGGRVYTGKQALDVGLIDKIGGLHDAVEFAARKAQISDYEVRTIPETKDFIQILLGEMSGEGERPSDISVRAGVSLFARRSPLVEAILPIVRQLEPMRAKAMMQMLQRIELLRSESVITMMPMEIVIR